MIDFSTSGGPDVPDSGGKEINVYISPERVMRPIWRRPTIRAINRLYA